MFYCALLLARILTDTANDSVHLAKLLAKRLLLKSQSSIVYNWGNGFLQQQRSLY
jgi:hypothetical protein